MKALESDSIRKAKLYIEDNYGENISLDDIAGAASLSKYYFLRLFEKETGCAPWEYLTKTRIRAAMQLLAGSQETVSEIALACLSGHSRHIHTIHRAPSGNISAMCPWDLCSGRSKRKTQITG